MANIKITSLDTLATMIDADQMIVVDDSVDDKTKRITGANLRTFIASENFTMADGKDINIGGSGKLIISGTGNVGIGTTSPDEAKLEVLNSSDTAVIITQSGEYPALDVTGTHAGGSDVMIVTSSQTTGIAFQVNADDITTASLAQFRSTSDDDGTRDLVKIWNDDGSATGATCLKIQQDSTGYALVTTGGKVGIGTTAPNKPLEVSSAGDNDDVKIRLSLNPLSANKRWDVGIIGTGTGAQDARLAFEYGGSEKVSFLQNGNIGIGTGLPLSSLHVESATPYLTVSNSSTDIDADHVLGLINFYSNDISTTSFGGVGHIRVAAYLDFDSSRSPSYMAFYTHPDAVNAPTILGNATEKMRITPNGRVGIMKTDPDAPLHVKQASTDGATTVLKLEQADVDQSFLQFQGSDAVDSSMSISNSTATGGGKAGAIRIQIAGTTRWLRFYDSAV